MAILEYLEDVYPTTWLRPARFEDLDRARLFLRLPDIYFENAPRTLMGMRNAADRKEEVVATAMAALHRGLTYIDHSIDPAPWAVGGQPSIADSAIIPVLTIVNRVASVYESPDLISRFPRLSVYWNEAQLDPVHAHVIAEQLAVAPK